VGKNFTYRTGNKTTDTTFTDDSEQGETPDELYQGDEGADYNTSELVSHPKSDEDDVDTSLLNEIMPNAENTSANQSSTATSETNATDTSNETESTTYDTETADPIIDNNDGDQLSIGSNMLRLPTLGNQQPDEELTPMQCKYFIF